MLTTACSNDVSAQNAANETREGPVPCDSSGSSAQQDLPRTTGWTWFGITVGVSREQDVTATFGESEDVYAWPDPSSKPLASPARC